MHRVTQGPGLYRAFVYPHLLEHAHIDGVAALISSLYAYPDPPLKFYPSATT